MAVGSGSKQPPISRPIGSTSSTLSNCMNGSVGLGFSSLMASTVSSGNGLANGLTQTMANPARNGAVSPTHHLVCHWNSSRLCLINNMLEILLSDQWNSWWPQPIKRIERVYYGQTACTTLFVRTFQPFATHLFNLVHESGNKTFFKLHFLDMK